MRFLGAGLLAAVAASAAASVACVPASGSTSGSGGTGGSSSTGDAYEPPAPPPRVTLTVEEDEFTEQSTAALEAKHQSPHDFTVRIVAIPGEPEAGGRLTVVATSSEGWEYLRCPQLAAIVDGEAWGFLETDHDGRSIRGSAVMEMIRVDLTEEQLHGLVRATEIRMRLCNDEWEWPLETLHKMRELWELLYRPGPTVDEPAAANQG